jgi:hypothetical protein
MEISRSVYNELSMWSNKSKFTTTEVQQMAALIRNTFAPTFTSCSKCHRQIGHGQKLIKNFLSLAKVVEDTFELMYDPLTDKEPEVLKWEKVELDVDVVEAKKQGCSKCKKRSQSKTPKPQ